MSTESTATDVEHDDHDEDHEHGLSDWGYIKVAILLAVLTALEVATYFWDFGDTEVPLLIILMVLKFIVVVAYFMHLRFDNPFYTKIFVTGVVLTLGVFFAVFTSMVFWNDPGGCRVTTFQDCG